MRIFVACCITALLSALGCAVDGVAAGSVPDLPRPAELSGDPVSTLLAPDAIPAVDDPGFVTAAEATLRDDEPVLGLVVAGRARAYSLWQLDRHEIVNDTVAGQPVAVTW